MIGLFRVVNILKRSTPVSKIVNNENPSRTAITHARENRAGKR